MKRIYLSAIALTVSLTSFGQNIEAKKFENTNNKKENLTKNPSNIIHTPDAQAFKKLQGDTVWSENFDDGIPVGWQIVDNNSLDYLWRISDEPYMSYQGEITLFDESYGNFMLLPIDEYNRNTLGDGISGNETEMDSYFQTSAINIADPSGLSVVFRSNFQRCCLVNFVEADLVVDTLPDFSNPTDFDMIQGVAVNDVFDGTTTINITGALPSGYTGDIYLRFHVKSRITAYWWGIDNIQIVKPVANDIVASSPTANFWGVEYTRIPTSQIQKMNAFITASNIGSADQTNTNLNITIEDELGDDTTIKIPFPAGPSNIEGTINSLAFDTISRDSIWEPEAVVGKRYTVTYNVTSDDFTDATPENNLFVLPSFEITEGILALDDYSENRRSEGGGSNGDEYEVGNQFDCVADDDLYSIEAVTGDDTPIGAVVNAVLYLVGSTEAGATSYTELWSSDDYTITSGDIGNAKKFGNADGSIIERLESGSVYMAALHTFADYEYATSGEGPRNGSTNTTHSRTSYPTFANPTSGFVQGPTPMIRLDLKPNPTLGIQSGNASASFSVYPNPNNGEFTIRLDNDVKSANISVRNVVGQTVLNKTINVAGKRSEIISLSDYSKGVYFLTVNEDTVKLIVE
jgi:hypothetical protein